MQNTILLHYIYFLSHHDLNLYPKFTHNSQTHLNKL